MCMYPRIVVNTEKFKENLKFMINECHKRGVSVMGVSKVFCGDENLVQMMEDEGVDFIADSRISNLAKTDTYVPKVLLRLPMISEAEDVVMYSHISLNSELETIKELNNKAKNLDTVHNIILMIDLGDLREGIFEENEILSTVEEILKLKNIKLYGIGTNLTCYGGVIPSKETLEKLINYKNKIENKFKITLDIITGGNSSNIPLMMENEMPKGINNLRLGEILVLGRETAFGNFLDSMHDDVFTLYAEVIEVKIKPSVPVGDIGMNAFGKVPSFNDKGDIVRAILAIGQQDVDYRELVSEEGIDLIGSSSDHIIADVTKYEGKIKVGNVIKFKLTYASILSLFTSQYVGIYYE